MMLIASLAGLNISLNLPAEMRGNATADYQLLLEAGAPIVPYFPAKILLPFGEKYKGAKIDLGDSVPLRSGYVPEYARTMQPISGAFIQPEAPRKEIKGLYPGKSWEYLGTQYYRGYALAIINIFPFQYDAQRQELLFSGNIQINIQSEFDEAEAIKQAQFITHSADSYRQLGALVLNPAEKLSYNSYQPYYRHSAKRNLDLSTPYTLLIITDENRLNTFADYVSWKISKGISTGIYSTQAIYAAYEGEDNAAKVRNFIIDAYSTFSETPTPLEYVILGGDDELVPERGVFGKVGDTRDNRMPSDLYYSNLDGDWNANGNSIYGEAGDNVDYIPEIHIGRFPAETISEFQNIFRKTRYYVDNNTFSNNKAIFFGENLNNNPLTWGGDYKDEIFEYLPDGYHYQTQYQRDGSYSSESVWNALNSGVNVMNHMGHANENSLMGQGNGSIAQLNNTEYGFLYTQGCYPAAFDQRTSGDGESIAENMVMQPGGVFAFIGNTRYGWYMPGSTNGPSQFYDRDYFRGLFEEGHPELGRALTFSRLENLNTALSNDVMRWCYMEMILFGDPSVSVKLPDANLPMLSLQSYHFDDVLGDNDGNINPGEIIRLHPIIKNAAGAAIAQNIAVKFVSLPDGIQQIGEDLLISSLPAGSLSSEDNSIKLQLSSNIGFGVFHLMLEVDSEHLVSGLSTGVQRYQVSFEITMFDRRFPWETENGSKSAPIVADFEANGSLQIMYADTFGGIHFIDDSGEEYKLFQHPEQQNINRSGAMGALSNPTARDLVFSSRSGSLYAIDSTGECIFEYNAQSPFLFSPVIADIDGDGINEVIAGSLNGKLHVVNPDGSSKSGFPVQLTGNFQSELAVGDLDGDGKLEIICGMNAGNLFVVGHQGDIQSQHSKVLDGSLTGSPVILDNGRYAIASNSRLYFFENTGEELFSLNTESPVAGGIITADINRDGSLDIVFISVSGKLWVVSQAGILLPGFPVESGVNFNCPPLVADIDGDGNYEILLHSYINSLYMYKSDGSPMQGYPFGTTYNGATPGVLIDFDGNNQLKFIAGFSHGILMSNLYYPSDTLMPWTIYRGSYSRQASFASTGFVANAQDSLIPSPFKLWQNYPNPFNPSTTIRFELKDATLAKLEIYNMRGQKVKELLNGIYPQGSHSLIWDGTDDHMQNLPSGIYFYRLSGKGFSETKKMLLMK